MEPALALPGAGRSSFIPRRERPRLELPPPLEALAFVDVETTGLDPARHELLEVAVVRVDARSLEVLSEFSTLVAPEHLEWASTEALAVCGFSKAGWVHAIPQHEALVTVARHLEGCLLAGHNVGFDWSFLAAGFAKHAIPIPRIDYHRLDTASLAWPLLVTGEVKSLSLDPVAEHLGLDRPKPHRALADARCSLEVARRLKERMGLGGRFEQLSGDERSIVDALLARMRLGRKQYGPWHVDDGRDYPAEAYEEVLDGLHYVAAELVRQRQRDRDRPRRIYVCHPFAADPTGNIEKVRAISRVIVERGELPVAPHLYLPQFMDEGSERERALQLCLELLDTCDELRVFGSELSDGMRREVAHAKQRRIPVRMENGGPQ